jgi:hypothetical protein
VFKNNDLKVGKRQGYLFSPLLFNTILRVLIREIQEEKEIHVEKEKVKLSICR